MGKLGDPQIKGVMKALLLTENTVLFVDRDQIELESLLKCESLPKGMLIIAVRGEPNVQALSVRDLEAILERKRAQNVGL